MPFLEDLFFGKRDSTRRSAQDSSLTGVGGSDAGISSFGADTLLRSRGRAGAERMRDAFADDARKICGSVYCGTFWTAPWKSREQPIFEGEWACSSRCLAAMVRAALAREAGEGDYDDGPVPHHHRIPLGLVILAQGWITHPELQKALEAQRRHGSGRIGEWLVSECGMKPERIAGGLGVQWNCPVLSTERFWPEAMALALPKVFLEEFGAVPLRLAGKKILYIGFRDSLDASASFALEQMTALKTESGVLPETEFSRARETLLRCEFAPQTMAAVSDRDALARALADTIEHRKPEASRLVRLHRYYWLRVWAKGQGNRSAGDLPETVDGVNDYLFTIGNRLPRFIQEEKTGQAESRRHPIAEPENHSIFEEPMIGVVAEPTSITAAHNAAAIVGESAGSDPEPGETTLSKAEADAAEEDLCKAQTSADYFVAQLDPTQDQVAEEILCEFDETDRMYAFARDAEFVENNQSRHVDGTERINRSEELWSSLQRRILHEEDPIEGEYLPLREKSRPDLAIFEPSALVTAQPSGLSRIGRMLRLKPSYPDQEPDRAADRDRAR